MSVNEELKPETVKACKQIKVLYEDDDIIVLNKPRNLRSVPGNADIKEADKEDIIILNTKLHVGKRPRIDSCENDEGREGEEIVKRKTIQDSWVLSIETCGKECSSSNSSNNIEEDVLIKKLANLKNRASIPRKFAGFVRFCIRNQRTLFENDGAATSEEEYKCKVAGAFKKIKMRHEKMHHLRREPTPDSASAMGQLRLLGYEPDPYTNPIRVVHRLDCETSGLMVFARNEFSASILCAYWREKTKPSSLSKHHSVQKIYLAKVALWPPYHQRQIKSGVIDFPLAPSRTEKVKWEVTPLDQGGKASTTLWQIFQEELNQTEQESTTSAHNNKPITLLLHAITGRTHQLRIHCNQTGGTIIGDSLYFGQQQPSTARILHDGRWKPDSNTCLHLHAYKLSFPHPRQPTKIMDFMASKPW